MTEVSNKSNLLLEDEHAYIDSIHSVDLARMRKEVAEWISDILGAKVNPRQVMKELHCGVKLLNVAKSLQILKEQAKPSRNSNELQQTLNHLTPDMVNFTHGVMHINAQIIARQRINIAKFLDWCRDFGVRSITMFESEDLVMAKNERQVFNCILNISKIAATFGVEPPESVKQEIKLEQANRILKEEQKVKLTPVLTKQKFSAKNKITSYTSILHGNSISEKEINIEKKANTNEMIENLVKRVPKKKPKRNNKPATSSGNKMELVPANDDWKTNSKIVTQEVEDMVVIDTLEMSHNDNVIQNLDTSQMVQNSSEDKKAGNATESHSKIEHLSSSTTENSYTTSENEYYTTAYNKLLDDDNSELLYTTAYIEDVSDNESLPETEQKHEKEEESPIKRRVPEQKWKESVEKSKSLFQNKIDLGVHKSTSTDDLGNNNDDGNMSLTSDEGVKMTRKSSENNTPGYNSFRTATSDSEIDEDNEMSIPTTKANVNYDTIYATVQKRTSTASSNYTSTSNESFRKYNQPPVKKYRRKSNTYDTSTQTGYNKTTDKIPSFKLKPTGDVMSLSEHEVDISNEKILNSGPNDKSMDHEIMIEYPPMTKQKNVYDVYFSSKAPLSSTPSSSPSTSRHSSFLSPLKLTEEQMLSPTNVTPETKSNNQLHRRSSSGSSLTKSAFRRGSLPGIIRKQRAECNTISTQTSLSLSEDVVRFIDETGDVKRSQKRKFSAPSFSGSSVRSEIHNMTQISDVDDVAILEVESQNVSPAPSCRSRNNSLCSNASSWKSLKKQEEVVSKLGCPAEGYDNPIYSKISPAHTKKKRAQRAQSQSLLNEPRLPSTTTQVQNEIIVMSEENTKSSPFERDIEAGKQYSGKYKKRTSVRKIAKAVDKYKIPIIITSILILIGIGGIIAMAIIFPRT